MQRFEGRVAIVTGAASGIGRATAQRLVDEGATVVAVDRDEEALAEAAEAIGKGAAASAGILALVGDVGDAATATRAVATATDEVGRLDVLVNNAGILRFEHSHEVAAEDWDRVLRVNLTGTFQFCQAAIPRHGGGGPGLDRQRRLDRRQLRSPVGRGLRGVQGRRARPHPHPGGRVRQAGPAGQRGVPRLHRHADHRCVQRAGRRRRQPGAPDHGARGRPRGPSPSPPPSRTWRPTTPPTSSAPTSASTAPRTPDRRPA